MIRYSFKITFLIFLLLFFSSCGNIDRNELYSKLNKDQNKQTSTQEKKSKSDNQQSVDSPFASIKNLIEASQKGDISDVEYICYGDSLRSYSEYQNQYVFEDIKDELNNYNVKSINLSVTGLELKEALNPKHKGYWQNIVQKIANNGSTTILDISLGLNDYPDRNDFRDINSSVIDEEAYENAILDIKSNLETIIKNIKKDRPKTKIILTIPSRVYYDLDMDNEIADNLSKFYKELSKKYDIPYIDIPNEVMPLEEINLDWYVKRDGKQDYTHLRKEIQDKIADLILSKILP